MSEITIQIPALDEINHHIEVEVKVNGKKILYNYRVEKFLWDCEPEDMADRVKNLKRMIDNYDKDWQLFQIGNPTEKLIPIMFRHKVMSDEIH